MLHLLFSAFLLQASYMDLQADGHKLLVQGSVKEAETVLKEAAALNPSYAPTLKDLGEVYAKLRRFDDAIEMYRKAVDLAPKDVNARGRLAELYSWAGKHDKAIVTYRDALEYDPSNVGVKNGLATVLRWSHRYDEAERLYKELLAADPDNREALKGLAKTYAMIGDLPNSLKYLDQALRLAPNDAELHKERGTVLAWQKDYKGALASLSRASEISPRYADAYRTSGDVYTWMQDHRQAVASYKKAVELAPDDAGGYLLLAGAHLSNGDPAQAETYAKEALRLDPSNAAAERLLGRIREEGGPSISEKLSEWLEMSSFVFAFAAVVLITRKNRRVLKRRHRAFRYFFGYMLPGIIAAAFAAHVLKGAALLNAALVEEAAEGVILFSFGLSFFSIMWVERGNREFARSVILAVGAHPDDIELGCGGLIMKARDSGALVYGLTMTKGERGAEKRGAREAELTKAAGYMELAGFWACDFPDTELAGSVSKMKDEIEKRINEVGATLVVTHSPIDTHADHRAVFEASKVAARNASMIVYEDVSTPGEFVPDYFVDVSGYIEDKLRLVACHKTQAGKTYMSPESVQGRAAHRGIQCGVQYAEAFKVHKLVR